MCLASIKLQYVNELITVKANPLTNSYYLNDKSYDINTFPVGSPVSGTVYGTLFNYQEDLLQMEEKFLQKPYDAPPNAPILYIKPANTISYNGAPILMPKEIKTLEIGASLGVVIGKKAVAIKESEAFNYIAGYTIVNDVSIPHESIFRPAVPYKTRDGFCPIGPWIVEAKGIKDPNRLTIKIFVNEELKLEKHNNTLVRPIAKLLADITEFMTLDIGDTLLVGISTNSPQVIIGDKVRIQIDQIGFLENYIVEEEKGWLP